MAKAERDDQRQLARQQRILRKIERPFSRDVIREKNRYIREQSDEYKRSPILSDDLLIEHTQHMTVIFRKYYALAIRVAIGDTERSILTIKQDLFSLIFGEWLREEGADRIKETSQTTQNDMKTVLNRALEAEAPTSVAAQAILTAQGFSPSRAHTIARTETHNAAMFASRRTAETISAQTGLDLVKKWVPALDERTRANHAAMTRHKAISLDAKFLVGGARMDRPGDPAGGAANVINCRCVLVYKRKK